MEITKGMISLNKDYIMITVWIFDYIQVKLVFTIMQRVQRLCGVALRNQVWGRSLVRGFNTDPLKERGSAAENEWVKREERKDT